MDDWEDGVLGTTEVPCKKPLRILEIAIKRVVDFAIPLHIKTLQVQCSNIDKYQSQGDFDLAQSELILASNTVRLLKSDLYELQTISEQVEEEDVLIFQSKVEAPTNDIAKALANFLTCHSDAMLPLPNYDNEAPKDVKQLVCNLDEPPDQSNSTKQLMIIGTSSQANAEPIKVLKLSQKLMKEITELNELFTNFSKFVFGQKKGIDLIENNVAATEANVLNGSKELRKAVVLKAATLPLSGALLGGVLLGPIGAVAGFKLFGVLACAVSGSALGFGAGMKLKKRQQKHCSIEMDPLCVSSKQLSVSMPVLPLKIE